MAALGPLAFAFPWALVVLVLVPLLWWFLRVVPPAPRRVSFPAVRFLFGLDTTRRAAESTPLWLILLRIALASLLILAVAHPLLNPLHRPLAAGDMLIVIDDGWSSGRDWPDRIAAARNLISLADRQDRKIVMITTAPPGDGGAAGHSGLLTAAEAGRRVNTLVPLPWPVDRKAAAEALAGLDGIGQAFWLADDVGTGDDERLVATLRSLGDLTVMSAGGPAALALLEPDLRNGRLVLRAQRAGEVGRRAAWIAAEDADGDLLARTELSFAPGTAQAEAVLDMPSEIRNRIARLTIEDETTAAAVMLLDHRWKRPPVGVVSGGDLEVQESLLSPAFYLGRALENAAEPREETLERLLDRPPAVIVLADIGIVPDTQRPRLEAWIEEGGVLVRFAGPAFSRQSDDLVPVELRGRGRALGGAMSWTRAQRIAPFEPASPFAGLTPQGDVLIDRQVLAEPSADLGARTWARLEDGTPLVTALRRGEGWLVLVHTTANTQWTNLPLSGLFAQMMKRIAGLAEGKGVGLGDEPLPAVRTFSGFGVLGQPPQAATAIPASGIDEAEPGPLTPPGLYGTADLRRAFNLGPALSDTAAMDLPEDVETAAFQGREEIDLRPYLYGLAVLLAVAEFYASMFLRRLVPGVPGRARLAALAVAFAILAPGPAAAQEAATGIPDGVLDVRFGYVVTGSRKVDRISHAGLRGLGTILATRTSVEPGEPVAVEIETDDLVFYPMIYWPITQEQPVPSGAARARLDAYLATGGILVIDTRDADREIEGMSGPGPNAARLPEMLDGLNIPALMRVPQGHVLTRSYYLLSEFPGRWNSGSLWAEQHPSGVNDGVSAILIGSNDWAAAWALGDQLQPLFAVVPGGERQREMAFRFGINLAMYAMTGNYKADAVHLPTILERLGQ